MRSSLRVRITVREHVSERLATAFDGIALVHRIGATELVGEVVDQAQLHGVLTRISDLGLTLQSVTVLDADPARHPSHTPLNDAHPKQQKGAHA